MSTRSSARNLFPPLDNPELTIRRRSCFDPTLLNNSEMAAEGPGDLRVPDLRTMEELCQPSLNGRGGPISPIAIQATNFGLKNDMIQQVQNSCQFHGLSGDDANKHLDKFLHVTQIIKVNGVTDDALYGQNVSGKYFPPSMVTKLRNEITNFRQRPDESLFEAWEHLQIISEELAEYINCLSWNHPTFYDDDDEYFIKYKEYLENSSNAIIPVLPTEEPKCSLSMENEHLDTILEMKSDDLIKSSVEILVPIPSESEVTFDNESECDVLINDESSPIFIAFSNIFFDYNDDFTSSDDESLSIEDVLMENFKIYSNPLFDDEEIISTKIDPHYFNAESNLIESLLNRDILIDYSPKFDYLLKLAHINLIPPGIKEADFYQEKEIRLVENLFDDESLSIEDVLMENFKIYSNPLFDDEEIISTKIDPHYFNAESNLIESLLNRDILIDYSPKFDYLLKLAHINLIPPGIKEADFYQEKEILSLSPSPIPVGDGDSHMEEIDLFHATNDLMPLGIENDDYDSEGDIHFLEELFSNDPITLPKNESFNLDHYDEPSFPCPPLEPPDVEVFFDFEPDSGELISAVVNNIDELIENECFDPGGGEIDVFANVKDDDYFPFIFVIRIFLPYLIYPKISPLLLSTGSEDAIFDPDIST
nr:hypothetical protein [Tanacetum cinerariifolium]